MISAQVDLTQPLSQQRQFVARTGSEHYLLLDDSAGGTGRNRLSWLPLAWRDAPPST